MSIVMWQENSMTQQMQVIQSCKHKKNTSLSMLQIWMRHLLLSSSTWAWNSTQLDHHAQMVPFVWILTRETLQATLQSKSLRSRRERSAAFELISKCITMLASVWNVWRVSKHSTACLRRRKFLELIVLILAPLSPSTLHGLSSLKDFSTEESTRVSFTFPMCST